MLRIKRNKLICTLLVFGVVMQVLAMMPHHHHTGSEAACINFLHLSHDHADSPADCCGDDHGHDSEPSTPCNTHTLVITQPGREKAGFEEVEISVPDDCHCASCVMADAGGITEYATSCFDSKLRNGPDIDLPAVKYIGKGLSPRAPDFLA